MVVVAISKRGIGGGGSSGSGGSSSSHNASSYIGGISKRHICGKFAYDRPPGPCSRSPGSHLVGCKKSLPKENLSSTN